MIPLLRTVRSASSADLRADVVAGATTAVMLVPQAMAYAMLAGLDPIVGLYASTLPLALYALVGSSRPLAVGPVAMDSLMVAAGLLPLTLATTESYASAAAVLALMVGAIQLGLALLRAGFLVRFLAQPVITGFTAAAALIIGVSQLGSALGLALPRSQQVHVILAAAAERLGDIQPHTLAITAVSVATLVVLKRFAPRFPRFLLVVVVGTLVTWAGGLAERGVAIVGAVPAGLPGLSIPTVDVALVPSLFPIAFAIALVAMMEAIAVGKRYDDDLVPDRELFGIGLANVGSSLVGGYPITGGFSRTAVNAAAGARSPVAGLVTSGIVVIVLLFFTSGFHHLPKAVLASIIMTAVIGLVDVASARRLWREDRVDLLVAGITFAATLALGIQLGMATGVAVSVAALLWRTARPELQAARADDGALVVRVNGPLYFGNVEEVEARLVGLDVDEEVRTVVFDASALGRLDSVAQGLLGRLDGHFAARGVALRIRTHGEDVAWTGGS
jgi:SulP family sulfate permease